MVKWFEYGSGELSQDSIRLPGLSTTWHNGDKCPEGTPDAGKEGTLQVFVNGAKLDDWSRYIPHDGDRIQLIFGPEQQIVQLDDRQVIDEGEATRTIDMNISGDESQITFDPSAPTMKVGETVKIVVHNKTTLSQGLRVAGPDGKYNTADDFVAVPNGSDPKTADKGAYILAGQDGFVVVRFDNAGQIKFQDPVSDTGVYAESNIIVEGASSAARLRRPSEAGEQTADVKMTDGAFDPATVTLEAGKTFSINLTNNDPLTSTTCGSTGPTTCSTRQMTSVSSDVSPTGGTGQTPAKSLDAGSYQIRDDFNKTTMTGTVTVQ